MIAILLTALGVPIWLVIGALLGALWSRRMHRNAPGVFPCKIRTISPTAGPGGWGRRTEYARWVHDVLIVHSGLALVRIRALPVRDVAEVTPPNTSFGIKGAGQPVARQVTLDDGSVLELATPAPSAQLAAGPFRVG
jgi:hypothetical protein